MKNILISAKLISSTIDRSPRGKAFIKLCFERGYTDGSRTLYYRYLNIPDAGPLTKFSLYELQTMGFKGQLADLYNQGTHNKSNVLEFEKEFELELEEFNGKWGVNRVRESGVDSNKSSLSILDVKSLFEDVRFKDSSHE